MSSLEKALIALRTLPVERKHQPTVGACHLGTGPNLVLSEGMRIFTGFRLLYSSGFKTSMRGHISSSF